jgi:uncharacterized RDD family membrane protein YckC
MKASQAVFAKIRIETPENVAFRYELAGPGTRMIAYLIDFMILSVALAAINYLFLTVIASTSRYGGDPPTVVIAILIAINAILFLFGGYFILFEFLMKGMTPGKSMMGIRVIQENGAHASLQSIILRNIFRIVECHFPFQYALGAMILIFNPKTQRLGDSVSGTIVIKERKGMTAANYRWKQSDIVTVFKKEVSISREEFDYLIEYVRVFRNLDLETRNRISYKLAANLVKYHNLEQHDDFADLAVNLNQKSTEPVYKRAEAILKKVLDFYLQN